MHACLCSWRLDGTTVHLRWRLERCTFPTVIPIYVHNFSRFRDQMHKGTSMLLAFSSLQIGPSSPDYYHRVVPPRQSSVTNTRINAITLKCLRNTQQERAIHAKSFRRRRSHAGTGYA